MTASTGSWPLEMPGLALAKARVDWLLGAGHATALAAIELTPFVAELAATREQPSDLLFEAIELKLAEQFRAEGCEFLRLTTERHLVIVPGASGSMLAAILERIAAEWARGIRLGSLDVTVEIVAGIGTAPAHGMRAQELLRQAACALREARNSRVPQVVYRDGLEQQQARRAAIRRALGSCIARRELRLVYQPQVSLRTRRIHGFEALLRWKHPALGEVSPAEFIPIAEDSRQIGSLTEWVVNEALTQLASWESQGGACRMSVNLSALDLMDDRIEQIVSSTLRARGLGGQRLILELTEHALVEDISRAADAMRRLARLGIGLSLDDFGSGHSTLRILRELPLSEIKVDALFTTDLRRGARDEAIVQSAVSLAHSLKLQIVAEGIESAEALLAAGRLGCDRAQGYFVGAPVGAHQVHPRRFGLSPVGG